MPVPNHKKPQRCLIFTGVLSVRKKVKPPGGGWGGLTEGTSVRGWELTPATWCWGWETPAGLAFGLESYFISSRISPFLCCIIIWSPSRPSFLELGFSLALGDWSRGGRSKLPGLERAAAGAGCRSHWEPEPLCEAGNLLGEIVTFLRASSGKYKPPKGGTDPGDPPLAKGLSSWTPFFGVSCHNSQAAAGSPWPPPV